VNDLSAVTGGGEEVDVQITNNMEKEGEEDMQVIDCGPPSQPCKCRRLPKVQSGLLQESFEQNNSPDNVTSALECSFMHFVLDLF
jgi:hypothetical protein